MASTATPQLRAVTPLEHRDEPLRAASMERSRGAVRRGDRGAPRTPASRESRRRNPAGPLRIRPGRPDPNADHGTSALLPRYDAAPDRRRRSKPGGLSVAAFSFASALSVLERLKVNDVATDQGRLGLRRDLGDLDALLLGCYARLREHSRPGTEARSLNDELLIRTADLGAGRSLLISLGGRVPICWATCPDRCAKPGESCCQLRDVEQSLKKARAAPDSIAISPASSG